MNLLPPALINQRKIKRYLRIMAALWAVFFLLILLIVAGLELTIRRNREESAALARQNRDGRYSQSDALAKSLQVRREWLLDIQGQMAELDFTENVSAREIRPIIASMPEGIRMRSVRAEKADARLFVEGVSTGKAPVSAYMEALMKRLYDVSLLSMANGSGGEIIFVIEIRWEHAPDG